MLFLFFLALSLVSLGQAQQQQICPKELGSRCCRTIEAQYGLMKKRIPSCGGTTRSLQNVYFTNSAPVPAVVGGSYTSSGTATGTSFEVRLATGSTGCSLVGNRVNFNAAGTCRIYAFAAASINFFQATSSTVSFAIANPLSQTISLTQPPAGQVSGPCSTISGSASSGLSVSIVVTTTNVCTLSSTTPRTLCYQAAGTCSFRGTQSGNFQYAAATTVTRNVNVAKGTHVVTVTSTPPATVRVGSPLYSFAASSNRGIGLAFPTPTGGCSFAVGSLVRFTAAGPCTLRATGGSANFVTATGQEVIQVAKGINFVSITSTPPASTQVGVMYTLTASATFGTPGFSLAPSSNGCTLATNRVMFTVAGGTCVVNANVAESVNYLAGSGSQSIGVALTPQTLSWVSPVPANAVMFAPGYQASATATSGLTVAFSTQSATICQVDGAGLVTYVRAGTCTLYANQNGVPGFNSALRLTRSWTIAMATQTISFTTPVPPTPAVFQGSYSILATASSGLVVQYSSLTPTICTVNAQGGPVQLIAGGTCTIAADQSGSPQIYSAAARLSRTFVIAPIAQTIEFVTTPTGVLLEGDTYTVNAQSTSLLPVVLTVDPSSAGVCSIAARVLSSIAPGTCTINANVAATANYLAAPQLQQSFRYVSPNSPDALLGCTTPAMCITIQDNIFGPALALESAQKALVEAVVTKYENCTTDPWLSVCNQGRITEVFGLNEARVANLFGIIQNLTIINASCATPECRAIVEPLLLEKDDVAEAAGTSCGGELCRYFASGQSERFKALVSSGAPGALAAERARFDSYVLSESQQRLEVNTFEYSQCPDEACRERTSAQSNVSFAILNLLAQARTYETQVANETRAREHLNEIDSNFTKCSKTQCQVSDLNEIFRMKRAVLRYVTMWQERLTDLSENCSTDACHSSTRAAMVEADRNVFLASDYLIPEITMPSLVLMSLVLVACIAVAVLGACWGVFSGKELFWLVLGGVLLTSVFRLAFWTIGAAGVGTTSLIFVVIDKLAALFFALTILVFVFMWARAIAILADANSKLILVMAVAAVAISVAILAVTIVYALQISRDFVGAFYGISVADQAEIILAVFSFVLIVALFALVLVVGSRLAGMSSTIKVEEKLRNLRIIALAVGFMVLMLSMRLILVLMRNFYREAYIGYLVVYLVSTLVPEVVCCLIMLGLVLFTFFNSKQGSGMRRSDKSFSSTSYVPLTDTSDTARYEV